MSEKLRCLNCHKPIPYTDSNYWEDLACSTECHFWIQYECDFNKWAKEQENDRQ